MSLEDMVVKKSLRGCCGMIALGDNFRGYKEVPLLTTIHASRISGWALKEAFFCVEREVNSGWPALKEIL